ncbi:MAG: Hydroxyacid dehydrogenase [Candidatus Poribacteria bacterium]|nr:Hydroxyacid dehydrogenase [Candidatus Poribacteria bacterium]
MRKPKILYIPTNSHTERVFRKETFERMLDLFDVKINGTNTNYTTEWVAKEIAGFDGLVTGWGTPDLTEEVFENADKLKIISHSAGSVKGFLKGVVEKYLIPRNICVFSANDAIALNVAEMTIGMMIIVPRRIIDHALVIRNTDAWHSPDVPSSGQYLSGSTIGIVSASKVGKHVIERLKPFDVEILVYDPYLSDYEAGRIGIKKVDLDDLFARADIVSIHAPSIPQTNNMIGEKQLKALRNGATLINTSRGSVIDHNALLAEAQTGRIFVALDVTTPEPLPPDSPFRNLTNVIITPHVSGSGAYGYYTIGSTALQALEDFFAKKPVVGAVDLSKFEILA